MGKNNKGGSLKVPDRALKILNQYKAFQENQEDLVFPELKGADFSDAFITQRTIAFKTSAIDKCLKTYVAPAAGISKKLTMHLARHSFAQVASDKTTQQTDDALDAVLNMPLSKRKPASKKRPKPE